MRSSKGNSDEEDDLMLLLPREDIKKVFTIQDAVEADKKAFQLVMEGKCSAPLRTNIQANPPCPHIWHHDK